MVYSRSSIVNDVCCVYVPGEDVEMEAHQKLLHIVLHKTIQSLFSGCML